MYKIDWDRTDEFSSLGDFFLRGTSLQVDEAPLVSPAESHIVDGPAAIDFSQKISVKGIPYDWKAFRELDIERYRNGVYWNFYLAPHNYHWVHSPSAGKNLEGIEVPGLLWPVNAWGRRVAPLLYSENSRITYRFETEEFGQVAVICVGALAVSSLYSEIGDVKVGVWSPIKEEVKKAERLLAFRLGSSVLLLLEKPPTSKFSTNLLVRVGESLVQKA